MNNENVNEDTVMVLSPRFLVSLQFFHSFHPYRHNYAIFLVRYSASSELYKCQYLVRKSPVVYKMIIILRQKPDVF